MGLQALHMELGFRDPHSRWATSHASMPSDSRVCSLGSGAQGGVCAQRAHQSSYWSTPPLRSSCVPRMGSTRSLGTSGWNPWHDKSFLDVSSPT